MNNTVKLKGRDPRAWLTRYWAEDIPKLDRQHLLPEGTVQDIRNAVDSLREALFDNGGFVLQMEAGPGANPYNVIEDIRRNVELNP